MPIQELLLQAAAEHEALQERYNEALVEISLLRTRFLHVDMPEDSTAKIVEEDKEADPLQPHFLCEPVHGTLDPKGLVVDSETAVEAEVQPRFSCDLGVVRDSQTNVEAEAEAPRAKSKASRRLSTNSMSSYSSHASFASYASWESFKPASMLGRLRATLTSSTMDFLEVGSFRSVNSESGTGNACQDKLIGFLQNKVVELFFVLVVISNVAVLWVEADRRAARLPKAVWSDSVNVLYLVIYSSEFIVRVFAYRSQVFDDKWNRLDFGVIATDILLVFIEALFGSNFSAAIFRLLRVFRLVRVFAIFRYVPELKLLIHGFFGAMRAVFFATVILLIVILLWSFILVEAVNPQIYELTQAGKFDDCPRCQRSYHSIWDAHLTLMQQIVANDSWGSVTLDVIFEHPETAVLFVGSLMSIQFAVLNLIFTVIVDAAMRSREEDDLLTLAEKEASFQHAKAKLTTLCESLDLTGSGDISLEELVVGYESNEMFADAMASLDITREDLGILFLIMDDNHSGSVTKEKFVNNLYKMKERDIKTTLMFLQVHLQEMRFKIKEEVTSLLKSNLKRSRESAKQMEKMRSRIETMMQYLEMQNNDQDDKAELRSLPEEDSSLSVLEAATDNGLVVMDQSELGMGCGPTYIHL